MSILTDIILKETMEEMDSYDLADDTVSNFIDADEGIPEDSILNGDYSDSDMEDDNFDEDDDFSDNPFENNDDFEEDEEDNEIIDDVMGGAY